MTFLDRSIRHLCGACGGYKSCSSTIGDALERLVAAAWSSICLVACLDHLIVPLARGDLPEWGSAALVLAILSGIRLSLSVWGFRRGTSSVAAEEGPDGISDVTIGQTKPWRRHSAVTPESRSLSKDAHAADPRESVGADAIRRPPSSIPSESIQANPSATALPRRPSELQEGHYVQVGGKQQESAGASPRKPLQQIIGSVNREEMLLSVRSGQVRPPMALPKKVDQSDEFRSGQMRLSRTVHTSGKFQW